MPSIDPSIKVTKTFTYRGALREFSNRYYFDNLKPADATKWGTLSDAVVAAEKLIYYNGVGCTITGTTGYDAGSDVPVYSKAYSQLGTGAFSSVQNIPGDAAALVRYSTSAMSSKNHPIYLFNYYHAMVGVAGGAGDLLNVNNRTALQTYAAAWITGFSDGSVTHHRCGPNGHVATGSLVDSWIRHRDFPAG